METTTQSTAPEVIKTAVIEDMKDIRDGLATLINFTDGFRCTGSYRSMEEALARLDSEVQRNPSVKLMSVVRPSRISFMSSMTAALITSFEVFCVVVSTGFNLGDLDSVVATCLGGSLPNVL